MNKQRKVLITITYNEMGIIIDTKAEEVAQPVAKDINVPCTDTISRQAAIDAVLWGITYAKAINKDTGEVMELFKQGNEELTKAVDRIKELPSVQKWIPVTERLPEDDEDVIVSCTDDSGDTPFSYTTVAWHFKGTWVCNDERCFFITAWMPLPEPWKG